MILVAAVALAISAAQGWRAWNVKRAYCLRKAGECADVDAFYLRLAEHARKSLERAQSKKSSVDEEATLRAAIDELSEGSMNWEKWRLRYERAAIYPWVRIPAVPPQDMNRAYSGVRPAWILQLPLTP